MFRKSARVELTRLLIITELRCSIVGNFWPIDIDFGAAACKLDCFPTEKVTTVSRIE